MVSLSSTLGANRRSGTCPRHHPALPASSRCPRYSSPQRTSFDSGHDPNSLLLALRPVRNGPSWAGIRAAAIRPAVSQFSWSHSWGAGAACSFPSANLSRDPGSSRLGQRDRPTLPRVTVIHGHRPRGALPDARQVRPPALSSAWDMLPPTLLHSAGTRRPMAASVDERMIADAEAIAGRPDITGLPPSALPQPGTIFFGSAADSGPARLPLAPGQDATQTKCGRRNIAVAGRFTLSIRDPCQ